MRAPRSNLAWRRRRVRASVCSRPRCASRCSRPAARRALRAPRVSGSGSAASSDKRRSGRAYRGAAMLVRCSNRTGAAAGAPSLPAGASADGRRLDGAAPVPARQPLLPRATPGYEVLTPCCARARARGAARGPRVECPFSRAAEARLPVVTAHGAAVPARLTGRLSRAAPECRACPGQARRALALGGGGRRCDRYPGHGRIARAALRWAAGATASCCRDPEPGAPATRARGRPPGMAPLRHLLPTPSGGGALRRSRRSSCGRLLEPSGPARCGSSLMSATTPRP